MQSHKFSREELLTTMQEAEGLATHIDSLPEGNKQMGLIYRWAALADKAAMLMVQAEELLPGEELAQLQQLVNEEDETRWEKYRRNIRWMNKPPG